MKLVVFAINVHQGGGAVLLNTLLSAVSKYDLSCVTFLDKRLNFSEKISERIQLHRIAPTIFHRLRAEQALKDCLNDNDVVLCFGNLPPVYKLNARTILFVQNRYLIDNISLKHFNIKTRLRIVCERVWLKLFSKNIDTIIVQTPGMQTSVSNYLGRHATILPFAEIQNSYSRTIPESINTEITKNYDFIYVASGEPHKNHKKLVEAWQIMAAEGLYPVLCLTLSETSNNELLMWINSLVQKYELKIVNVGNVTKEAVDELYQQSKALIYPSTSESFGLPLIEARNANLPIVASELDYVRDVLDPEETFEPSSPKSIARAVKRFLGYEENFLPVVDAKDFLNFCLKST